MPGAVFELSLFFSIEFAFADSTVTLSELPELVREEKLVSDDCGSSKNFGKVVLLEDSGVSGRFRVLLSENVHVCYCTSKT